VSSVPYRQLAVEFVRALSNGADSGPLRRLGNLIDRNFQEVESAIDSLVGAGKVIRFGKHLDTVAAGAAGETVTVSFGTTFSADPIVVATLLLDGTVTAFVMHLRSITTTGFTYRAVRTDGATFPSNTDYAVTWVAIGPPA
jgi:hypothetical protein